MECDSIVKPKLRLFSTNADYQQLYLGTAKHDCKFGTLNDGQLFLIR